MALSHDAPVPSHLVLFSVSDSNSIETSGEIEQETTKYFLDLTVISEKAESHPDVIMILKNLTIETKLEIV